MTAMTTTQPTEAQQQAIATQVAVYDTPDCPCDGLASHEIRPGTEWGAPEGSVAVSFHYFYEDDRAGTGLEITIFAPDGKVTDSQDFG